MQAAELLRARLAAAGHDVAQVRPAAGAFFAEHRLLRRLPEPFAGRALDTGDRRAHGDDDGRGVATVRDIIAPYRRWS